MLFTLVLLSPIWCFSQGRVNAELAQWGDSIGTLDSAVGWMFNRDGKWVSIQNTIPVCASSEYDALLKHEERGLGVDNFVSYEFRKIAYGGSEYLLFMKNSRRGGYKYKSIKEGWYEFSSTTAYLLPLEFLDSIKTNTLEGIQFISNPILAEYSFVDYAKRYSSILDKVKGPVENKRGKKLVFHVGTYHEKDIVQFQIYTTEQFLNSAMIGGIVREHKPDDPTTDDYKTIDIYGNSKLFTYCYYETTVTGFRSLFETK